MENEFYNNEYMIALDTLTNGNITDFKNQIKRMNKLTLIKFILYIDNYTNYKTHDVLYKIKLLLEN